MCWIMVQRLMGRLIAQLYALALKLRFRLNYVWHIEIIVVVTAEFYQDIQDGMQFQWRCYDGHP